jgi:hypothetical protein
MGATMLSHWLRWGLVNFFSGETDLEHNLPPEELGLMMTVF